MSALFLMIPAASLVTLIAATLITLYNRTNENAPRPGNRAEQLRHTTSRGQFRPVYILLLLATPLIPLLFYRLSFTVAGSAIVLASAVVIVSAVWMSAGLLSRVQFSETVQPTGDRASTLDSLPSRPAGGYSLILPAFLTTILAAGFLMIDDHAGFGLLQSSSFGHPVLPDSVTFPLMMVLGASVAVIILIPHGSLMHSWYRAKSSIELLKNPLHPGSMIKPYSLLSHTSAARATIFTVSWLIGLASLVLFGLYGHHSLETAPNALFRGHTAMVFPFALSVVFLLCHMPGALLIGRPRAGSPMTERLQRIQLFSALITLPAALLLVFLLFPTDWAGNNPLTGTPFTSGSIEIAVVVAAGILIGSLTPWIGKSGESPVSDWFARPVIATLLFIFMFIGTAFTVGPYSAALLLFSILAASGMMILQFTLAPSLLAIHSITEQESVMPGQWQQSEQLRSYGTRLLSGADTLLVPLFASFCLLLLLTGLSVQQVRVEELWSGSFLTGLIAGLLISLFIYFLITLSRRGFHRYLNQQLNQLRDASPMIQQALQILRKNDGIDPIEWSENDQSALSAAIRESEDRLSVRAIQHRSLLLTLPLMILLFAFSFWFIQLPAPWLAGLFPGGLLAGLILYRTTSGEDLATGPGWWIPLLLPGLLILVSSF